MLPLSKQVSPRKLSIVAPDDRQRLAPHLTATNIASALKLASRHEEDLDHGQGSYFGAPNPVDESKPMVASG